MLRPLYRNFIPMFHNSPRKPCSGWPRGLRRMAWFRLIVSRESHALKSIYRLNYLDIHDSMGDTDWLVWKHCTMPTWDSHLEKNAEASMMAKVLHSQRQPIKVWQENLPKVLMCNDCANHLTRRFRLRTTTTVTSTRFLASDWHLCYVVLPMPLCAKYYLSVKLFYSSKHKSTPQETKNAKESINTRKSAQKQTNHKYFKGTTRKAICRMISV